MCVRVLRSQVPSRDVDATCQHNVKIYIDNNYINYIFIRVIRVPELICSLLALESLPPPHNSVLKSQQLFFLFCFLHVTLFDVCLWFILPLCFCFVSLSVWYLYVPALPSQPSVCQTVHYVWLSELFLHFLCDSRCMGVGGATGGTLVPPALWWVGIYCASHAKVKGSRWNTHSPHWRNKNSQVWGNTTWEVQTN